MKINKLLLLLVFALLVAPAVWSKNKVKLQWQTLKTIGEPDNRHENAFVDCDGLFYLIGGRRLKTVDVYDPKSNTWVSKGKTPFEMHHFQALSYKGKIYVAGAQKGPYPHEPAIPNIYIYNPEDDSWEKGSAIPEDRLRGASGFVEYNNKFYMVCGITDGHYSGHVKWFDEYDPSTGEWKRLSDAPRARDHFHAVINGHKLYLIGGRNTSKKTNEVFSLTVPEVDVYDFKTGTWETLENNLPTERAGCTAAVYKNKIYVLCGESGKQKEAHNEVDVLNLKTGEWEIGPKLNQGRHGTQVILYKGRLYLACGSANKGGGPELNNMEMLKLK